MRNPILLMMFYIDYMPQSIHSNFRRNCWCAPFELYHPGWHLCSTVETIFGLSVVGPEAWAKIQNYPDVFCIKAFLRILSSCPAQYFWPFPCLTWCWESSPATICVGLRHTLPGVNWIVRGPKVLLWHLVQRWELSVRLNLPQNQINGS